MAGPHPSLVAHRRPLSETHVVHGDVGYEHVGPTEDPGAAPAHSRCGGEKEHGRVPKTDVDTLRARKVVQAPGGASNELRLRVRVSEGRGERVGKTSAWPEFDRH